MNKDSQMGHMKRVGPSLVLKSTTLIWCWPAPAMPEPSWPVAMPMPWLRRRPIVPARAQPIPTDGTAPAWLPAVGLGRRKESRWIRKEEGEPLD